MSKNKKYNLFKAFIELIGQNCAFKLQKNELLLFMKAESEKDLDKYNHLLEKLNLYWQNYKENSEIAYLLEEHYEEIFHFYLSQIFPFRSEALNFEGSEAMSPVDFKTYVKYRYNKAEIEAIEKVKFKLRLKDKTGKIFKSLLIFSFSSIAIMIEKVFSRPFAAQMFLIDPRKVKISDNEDILITVGIYLREQ